MRTLASATLLVCLSACNSILGVKDLSGGDDSADAGTDSVGSDGAGPSISMRFLLVTPDIFSVSVDADAQLFAAGVKVADAVYGQLTTSVQVPLDLAEIELRGMDGQTVLGTAPVTFDEYPGEGERVIGVIAGNLAQTDTTAADHVRVAGFNEVLFPSGDETYVKVVHAIADRPDVIRGLVSYSGDSGIPSAGGPLGASIAGAVVPPSTEIRVRLGATELDTGAEEISFTVPLFAEGEKALLVAAGRQHSSVLDQDPGLSLIIIPLDGAVTRVRSDPVFFVANFLVDWADDSLALNDADTGLPVSSVSNDRSRPMLVFARPNQPTNLALVGLPTPFSFALPEVGVGGRYFIALTGFMSPGTGQPGVQTIELDHLNESQNASETNVAFVNASPDPAQIDAVLRNMENDAIYPFGTLIFRSVGTNSIPTNVAAQFRVFLPGNTTPLRSFVSELEGRRQITVLSGVETGSPETLRTTNVDMRTWPWVLNAPIVGN